MDLNTARTLAENLICTHKLDVKGWTFAFDNAENRLGQCDYRRKRITMSHKMVRAADEATVRQTAIHEVAHALTPGAKHGPAWLKKARELGYTGERTSHNPHQDQRMKAMLPEHLRHLEADETLRPGDTAVIILGRSGTIGMTATVMKRNQKTYDLLLADGRRFRYAMHAVAKAPEGMVAAPTVPAAQPGPQASSGVLREGEEGVINQGRYRGTKVRILKVNRTRYRVSAMGTVMDAPMEMVSAA